MNVGYSTDAILTSDGCVSTIGEFEIDGCCPIDACNIDPCALMCNFIQLMPNGPLWDRAKSEGMARYQTDACFVGLPCTPDNASCSTLIDYAAYSGYRLANLIQGPLWAALREATPYTAVETLDSWLELYGWSNCWETACRDTRLGPSPLDCDYVPGLDACDANYSPVFVPTLPTALENALKRGVAIAMKRYRMAPIKNLCGINWIIEPLGAHIYPTPGAETDECCKGLKFEICNLSDTIESAPGLQCAEQTTKQIPAYVDIPALAFNVATGVCESVGPGTVRIWPAVMAAQCIAISLIPSKDCETPILRCPAIG